MSFNGFGSANNIQPVQVDSNVKFSSIGGLKEHIKCLREMIIFPLMYPELFKQFNTRPAKGVLFHGPPGTGKTLLARALANECTLVGGRKVVFFLRKGDDVLDKYYGESQKNLRNLFQKARQMKPSIIFFDEIDALASVRKSSSSEHNIHSSVVATLLAEMDGLCDRGDVIVIGATNRPDAIDPAVRRAGRFDRELYFPPPEADARRDILTIYTREWEPSLCDDTLDHIAQVTVGYSGSDIKSLCSEAVLKAVRRVYPQIYETDYKLLIDAKNVQVTTGDLLAAMEVVVPSACRYEPTSARPLPVHLAPLLHNQLLSAADLMSLATPSTTGKRQGIVGPESTAAPSAFLVVGDCAETYIAPALLMQLEHCIVKELNLSTLHSAHIGTPAKAVISLFAECRRTGRACVIFIRDLLAVWESLASKHGAAVLLQLWRRLRSIDNDALLLATCSNYEQLPSELKEIFPLYKDCIYHVRKPTVSEVTSFLMPVIMELPLVPPVVYKNDPPPPLPRAPPVVPLETEEDMVQRLFRESDNLRRLWSSLRSICRSLSYEKRYLQFTLPVDTEAIPDYLEVIKQPMDLVTVMSKLEDKKYLCAKEFLDDVDLICTNALQYNRIKSIKKSRSDATSLYSDAHTMVEDEIDAQLELECQLIARRRRERGDNDQNNFADLNHSIYFSRLHQHPDFGAPNFSRAPTDTLSRKRRNDSHSKSTAKRPRFMSKNHRERDAERHSSVQQKAPLNEEQNSVMNVIINTVELDNIMKLNAEPLSHFGLETLVDLHTQLSKAVHAYAETRDRTQLPQELHAIVTRYLQLAKK